MSPFSTNAVKASIGKSIFPQKPIHKIDRRDIQQMHRYQLKNTTNIKKKQGRITSPKEHSNFLETDSNEKKIYKMVKKIKIIILKQLSEVQEGTDKQYKEIRKTI